MRLNVGFFSKTGFKNAFIPYLAVGNDEKIILSFTNASRYKMFVSVS